MGLFGWVHDQWADMHRWNRAAADASFLLIAGSMALGPMVRLWPSCRPLLPFRRELGVYGIVLALLHALIVLAGWLDWDLWRLVGLARHPQLKSYVMVEHGFGLANLVGVVALAYGAILMVTSNDRAVRVLTGPIWKFVQRGAYVLWMLVILHTAYFLFMHFLDFHRPVPDPNPLRWPFVVLVAAVLGLRWAAAARTWLRNTRTEVLASH